MNHLHLSGYQSVPIDALDKSPLSGFWLCVGIQVNETIEELTLSYIELVSDENAHLWLLFGNQSSS